LTKTSQTKTYDPIDTIARSLFGFALIAWIPMLITWILFVLSPVSPDANFAQIRTIIIVEFGIITILSFGIVVWLFRHQPPELLGISGVINRILGNRWLAIILIVLLLEINFIAFLTLGNIAPPITNPLKFLLVCWTLIFFGLMLTIHWLNIQAWLTRTQGLWVSIGLMMVAVVVLSGLLIITSQLINASGIIGRLQGSLDYRQLDFIDDGNAPTPQQFWAEQGQMTVRWLPYNYWTTAPFDGEYINVSSQGVRDTPSFTDDKSAQKIYFFGGSTMWGEGARDAYTIAGHVAQSLANENQPQHVSNYGQTGYVSTQDLILFQAQLALNNSPDIAIFYQGFNDIYSAYLQDTAGIPYREHQRVSDVEAGRSLRSGQPVFRLPDGDISTYDWSLIGTTSASAQEIADRWFANVKLIQTLAETYAIDVIFVWQPALFAKETLIEGEFHILEDLETASPNFISLYKEVDTIVRSRIKNENLNNIIILTSLFAENEQAIFYDLVHITEIGNLAVAEALLPTVLDLLE
jgi:lysophospholipase L1-like esterase